MATIEEFAKITMRVIAKDGFADYLPIAFYPGRRHLTVLEDAPGGSNLEQIVLEWASKGALGAEEFLVAFKVGPTKFKVVRRHTGGQEEGVFDATASNT